MNGVRIAAGFSILVKITAMKLKLFMLLACCISLLQGFHKTRMKKRFSP